MHAAGESGPQEKPSIEAPETCSRGSGGLSGHRAATGLESRRPGERAVRPLTWFVCWRRESLLLCRVPPNPVPVKAERDKELREQRRLPEPRGEGTACGLGPRHCLLPRHRAKRAASWAQGVGRRQLSGDAGTISNIGTETDHSREDVLRDHTLQAASTPGLTFRAEPGRASMRGAPSSPCP